MPPTLRFRPDGRLTIVQFTDLHWHNGEEPDQRTRAMMERILDDEAPDVVVLTGDAIAGGGCIDPEESLRRVLAPILERGFPWGLTYGNHDDEGSLSRIDLMKIQRSLPGCLCESGPNGVTGVGNTAIRIESSTGDCLAAALYLLDSNSYSTIEGIDGYGWFDRSQVTWVTDLARQLSSEYDRGRRPDWAKRLPALAFFHIPFPEYNDVWEFQTCRGDKLEEVCCPPLNTGMFAAFVANGDVMGCFVGHDHVNDYEGFLHGIRLCYGRWGGYHTYGLDRMIPGARMIEMVEGTREFQTWIRQDGDESMVTQREHAPTGRRSFSV